MGLFKKLTGGDPKSRSPSDEQYMDLDNADVQVSDATGTQIHFAEINDNQDIIKVKDALYDGDIVIVDLKYVASAGMNVDHVLDQLQVTVEEVNGDIVQKDEDTVVVSPGGVAISRDKL